MFGIDIILRFFHAFKDPESFEIVDDIGRIVEKYMK